MATEADRKDLRAIAAMARELVSWEGELGRAIPELSWAGGSTGAANTPRGPSTPSDRPEVAQDRPKRLRALQTEAAGCTRCDLHMGRTHSVFARGGSSSELVFVGEGPGHHEDQEGLPFVGEAGQLLDRMIEAMGYPQAEVYICNVVKCRPPGNRTPLPGEMAACLPYLEGQIALVAPRVIVALGRCAAQALGCMEAGEPGWRGRFSTYQGIPVMATYHPAYLLRNPQMKRPVWEDLQNVMAHLGRATGS